MKRIILFIFAALFAAVETGAQTKEIDAIVYKEADFGIGTRYNWPSLPYDEVGQYQIKAELRGDSVIVLKDWTGVEGDTLTIHYDNATGNVSSIDEAIEYGSDHWIYTSIDIEQTGESYGCYVYPETYSYAWADISGEEDGYVDIVCYSFTASNYPDILVLLRADTPTPPTPTSIVLSEGSTAKPAYDETTNFDDVTVNRTMKANQWNTLCLPFDMSAAEVVTAFGEGVEVKKMIGITATGVVNYKDTTAIAKTEMYIVKPAAAVTSFKVETRTLVKGNNDYAQTTDMENGYSVNANFWSSTVGAPGAAVHTVLNGDKFYTVDQDVTVKGFRWFISKSRE